MDNIDKVVLAFLGAIADRDSSRLDELIKSRAKMGIPSRSIIGLIKNDPVGLELFLKQLGVDPGAGSYFFDNVSDNRTFDVYKKYNIKPYNLFSHTVTPTQWKYLLRIGYVRPTDDGSADTNEGDGENNESDNGIDGGIGDDAGDAEDSENKPK